MVVRHLIHKTALPVLLVLLTCETAVLAGATADTLQSVPTDSGRLGISDASSVSVAALAADAAADSVGGSPVVAADGTKAISSKDSRLPPLIPLQVLLSPARFRLPQVRTAVTSEGAGLLLTLSRDLWDFQHHALNAAEHVLPFIRYDSAQRTLLVATYQTTALALQSC